jgi:hypothetical protein
LRIISAALINEAPPSQEVASTVGAPLTEVPPLPASQSPPTAALGDHMLINAALAVQLCRTWEVRFLLAAVPLSCH